MKKYIVAVMLVLLSVSLVSAESDIERQFGIGHIEFRNAEMDRSSVRVYIINLGTTTAYDEIDDFARKNDLNKLACVNCKKIGGLYVYGIVFRCDKCDRVSVESEYQSQTQFYEGQEVWDVLVGRGTVEKVDRSRNDSMAVMVKMNDSSLGYDSMGHRWYALNGTYDLKDKTARLIDTKTKSINFTLDKLFPEKKQERLSVRELVGSETTGFKLSNWVSSYCCFVCGESLTTVYNSNTVWFCSKCKKYFNIEKKGE